MPDRQPDIVVLVPKRDEFEAHLKVFGVHSPIDQLASLRPNKYAYAESLVGGLTVLIVLLDSQGNAASAAATSELVNLLRPSHIYLSGTSLGNASRSRLGSVRVADNIDHITEWVVDQEGQRRPRLQHHQVPSAIRRDLGTFIAQNRDGALLQQSLAMILRELYPESYLHIMATASSDIELSYMVSDNNLHRDEADSVWSHDERSASYDMECGGFALALDGVVGINWAVVRGISDFGSNKSEAERGMRTVAALNAAAFIRHFLSDGLSKSHPRAMEPTEIPSGRLSPTQHFAQYSASGFVAAQLLDTFDFSYPAEFVSRSTTLRDLILLCQSRGIPPRVATRELERIRREYFEDKYVDYSYDVDIRGYFAEYWYQEFREFLAFYGRESLSRSTVLDVGAGNGLELPVLFTGAERIIAVDLSEDMLRQARRRMPAVETLVASGEDLSTLASDFVDVYVALRVYMSRFFDTGPAFAEALRLLKPGGLLVISIANGFLDTRDGEPVVIRGLKEVNGSETVDPSRPYVLLADYYAQLARLGFTQIFSMCRQTDVYLGAVKPGLQKLSPRLAAGDAG